MEYIFDPNIAYILLAGGIIFTVMAILNPGTGILEIGALFTLLAAGVSVYGLADQNMINWWSILIILAGMVFFIISVKIPKQPIYLVISIVLIIIGSVYLFRSDEWYLPSVNPFLAFTLSALSGTFFWIMTSKVLETKSIIPTHDLQSLIGNTGEAKSYIHKDGSVQVAGELWTARSKEPIQNGSEVRVIGREGFILIVETIND
jgi:membrane-bound serine protease (ClpP class)